MPGGYTQQSDHWALGAPADLLPIPQRVNADAQRFGKLSLCETGEWAAVDAAGQEARATRQGTAAARSEFERL